MTKIITNPKTVMMETVGERDELEQYFARKRLELTRRELRDMLSGNVQFHQDNLGPSPADTEKSA